MNKRQKKKIENKRDFQYDTSQKSYRDIRKYLQWEKMLRGCVRRKPLDVFPNYFGEY